MLITSTTTSTTSTIDILDNIDFNNLPPDYPPVVRQQFGMTTFEETRTKPDLEIKYNEWAPFGPCSATCGESTKTRSRTCSTGDDIDCLLNDLGDAIETVSCDFVQCPDWLMWEKWGECSASCEGGISIRRRFCSSGDNADCTDGTDYEERECNKFECPKFDQWTKWTECSVSCGGNGEQSRTRYCSTGNSDDCIGESIQVITCGNNACPKFGDWSEWGRCSVTCGDNGFKRRRRFCSTGIISDCDGDAVETESCEAGECPYYYNWSEWTDCSRTCGGGNRSRTRICSSGNPSDCRSFGPPMENERCSVEACPSWRLWSQWDTCSVSCGAGLTHRYRQCSTGIMADCFGDSVQQQQCYQSTCPTESPRTIITMPEEPVRFSSDNSFAPPRGGLGRIGNGGSDTNSVELSVQEFNPDEEYDENDFYMGAQLGYNQFGARENGKSTWDAALMNNQMGDSFNFEDNQALVVT